MSEQYKRTLLVSASQLKLTSVIELNTDEKILHVTISDVQNVELKAILQPELYNTVLLQVYNNKITSAQIEPVIKNLLDDYIKPFLVNAVLCDFIFQNQYKITNAGTEKLSGSNFIPVTPNELESAIQHYKAKKAAYKKVLLDELRRRKLLSKNAETSTTENFGFYIPEMDEPYSESTLESEGVIINDIIGMDFEEDTGELFLIAASANRITTNLDGRYRLSKQVSDIIHNGTFTLLQFNPANSNGCFIDYVITQAGNQRTGRIIANWVGEDIALTDYSSPTIGTLNLQIAFDYVEDRVVFNITSPVNEVHVTLLVTTI